MDLGKRTRPRGAETCRRVLDCVLLIVDGCLSIVAMCFALRRCSDPNDQISDTPQMADGNNVFQCGVQASDAPDTCRLPACRASDAVAATLALSFRNVQLRIAQCQS